MEEDFDQIASTRVATLEPRVDQDDFVIDIQLERWNWAVGGKVRTHEPKPRAAGLGVDVAMERALTL